MTDHQQQQPGALASMPAGSIFEPVTGEPAATTAAAHPDTREPRGNPPLERLDVERGLGKLERICGN